MTTRRLLEAIIIIVILLAAFKLYSISYNEQSAILIQRTNFYFNAGDVPNGEIVHHKFTIKNSDPDRAVLISDIKAGCACTSCELTKANINPKEEIRCMISVNTTGREDDIEGSVTILWSYANESTVHASKLGVKVHVLNILKIAPPNVDFGSVHDGDAIKTASVSLTRGDLNEPWDNITIDHSGTSILPQIVKEDSNHYELKLSVDPSKLPIGPFGDNFTINCYFGKIKSQRAFVIPASGSIYADLQSEPESIYFGVIAKGQVLSKSFTLSSEQNIHVISVTSTIPNCSTAIPQLKDGSSLKFICNFDSRGLHSNHNQSGKYLVTVEDGKEVKTLSIPFIAYIQ